MVRYRVLSERFTRRLRDASLVGREANFLCEVRDVIESRVVARGEDGVAVLDEILGEAPEETLGVREIHDEFAVRSCEESEDSVCCRVSWTEVERDESALEQCSIERV